MHHGPRRMRLHLNKIINPGDNSQRRQWPSPTYITLHARTLYAAQAFAACRVMFVSDGRTVWLLSPGLPMMARWSPLRLGPCCMRLLCLYGSGATAGSDDGAWAGHAYAISCAFAAGSVPRLCVVGRQRRAARNSGIGDNGPRI